MTVSTLEDGMLGRTLGSAALAIAVCFSVQVPARAQNLEAGKSPAQIFNGACTVCHKSPRGLVKSVPPGSLPGFLRQHYTTSSDMAGALSSYLLANGGIDRRPSAEKPRRGREAAPAVAAPAPAQNNWWPFRSQPPAQSADGVGDAGHHSGRKSSKHRKKSKAAKSKSHQENAPSHNAAGSESAKPESASSHAPKAEQENSAQRPDPVPAVTPAVEPKASETKSSEPSSATPHASETKPAEPKSSESKPSDSKAD
jgi:hypothetical protein